MAQKTLFADIPENERERHIIDNSDFKNQQDVHRYFSRELVEGEEGIED